MSILYNRKLVIANVLEENTMDFFAAQLIKKIYTKHHDEWL